MIILLSISYRNINDQVHDLYYYQYHIKYINDQVHDLFIINIISKYK